MWRCGLERSNWDKAGSAGWALTRQDWGPYKRGNLAADPGAGAHEDEGGDQGRHLSAREPREGPADPQKLGREACSRCSLTASEGTCPASDLQPPEWGEQNLLSGQPVQPAVPSSRSHSKLMRCIYGAVGGAYKLRLTLRDHFTHTQRAKRGWREGGKGQDGSPAGHPSCSPLSLAFLFGGWGR